MTDQFVDVLIIGAGLSGIGAACHLQRRCPRRTYAILEGRDQIGGTWDLFRYPGVRSDSDMFTLGYAFRPWRETKAIAEGPAILRYIQDTAREFGVERKIRFGHRALRARWSTAQAQWQVEAERGAERELVQIRCSFLFVCGGYYSYAQGYSPSFPGVERFLGRIVHPQNWPDRLDVAGQQVVVIGSGATAITLVPELAKTAAHVTMLQRSPSYVVARPAQDRIANWMRRHLPESIAYALARWQRILLGLYFYNLCKRDPLRARKLILGGVRHALGPSYDVERHFSPRYNPWEQRLCLVPDGDLFQAIRSQRASVVTDEIESFTEQGLRLASGTELKADLVVTATGLNLEVLAGIELTVDGRPIDLAQCFGYKGMMFSGVPNLASAFGYTNASWTLKCDLTCEYVCRILNLFERKGYRQCTPQNTDPHLQEAPWIDFSSGYFERSRSLFPKQGSRAPWKLHQNYVRDLMLLRYGILEDGVMEYAAGGGTNATPAKGSAS